MSNLYICIEIVELLFDESITVDLEEMGFDANVLAEHLRDKTGIEYPEFKIVGYGDFGHIKDWQLRSLRMNDLLEIARCCTEYGEPFTAYANEVGVMFATESNFKDSFKGTYNKEKEFAAEYANDTGVFEGASKTCIEYFDMESYAEDLIRYSFWSVDDMKGNNIFVFDNI
jgi:antirestriction protein